MNETSGNFQLREPARPEAWVPDSWVEPWMLWVGLALLLACLAAWFFLRRRKGPAPDPEAARRAALAEAASALEGIGEVPPREAAVLSSLILRKYLSVAAGDPALFETHEEYLSRHEALKDFSEDARGSASLGFSRLAAMKYGRDAPEMASGQVVAGSRSLLEILHAGFRA